MTQKNAGVGSAQAEVDSARQRVGEREKEAQAAAARLETLKQERAALALTAVQSGAAQIRQRLTSLTDATRQAEAELAEAEMVLEASRQRLRETERELANAERAASEERIRSVRADRIKAAAKVDEAVAVLVAAAHEFEALAEEDAGLCKALGWPALQRPQLRLVGSITWALIDGGLALGNRPHQLHRSLLAELEARAVGAPQAGKLEEAWRQRDAEQAAFDSDPRTIAERRAVTRRRLERKLAELRRLGRSQTREAATLADELARLNAQGA